MPSDLERQLPRFAERLDREAPAIAVDEVLNRGTVAVDGDRLERLSSDRVRRITVRPWGDALSGPGENGDRDASIELAPTTDGPPTRRRVALKVALAAAAVAVLVVALGAIRRTSDQPDPADVPPTTVSAPAPSTTPLPTTPVTGAPTSGGMWPQSSLEEVRAAQERAAAGDPDVTWQVSPVLSDGPPGLEQGGHSELVDRFLREELGWAGYILRDVGQGEVSDSLSYSAYEGQRYLRCAPGRTNPLYPPGPDPVPGELCAPTIDEVTYESVSLDLDQLDRQDPDGIWVVSRWELAAPFVQADPAVAEARGRQRLEEFLTARVAGTGAEEHVQGTYPSQTDPLTLPLLYATTSGASYERYEIERLDVLWPGAWTTFSARLFADGDATVVAQTIQWGPDGDGALWLDARSTTENGEPIALSHTSADGEVTLSAPSNWEMWWPDAAHVADVGVWFGAVWRPDDRFGNLSGSEVRIGFVDPIAYDSWCAENGGSPLLTAPADAAQIAQQVVADPDFEATAPVAARVGGVEAVSIDVTLAPGGEPCGVGMIDISRWIHELGERGLRLRLYLVDLPEGMSVETLAITVMAAEERFDDVIAETAPIIESIEFHPG